MTYFSNKVAIVTGGASGIGREITKKLCRKGAHVVIADIDLEKAQALSHELTSQGLSAQAVYLDVTDNVQVNDTVDSIVADHSRIDIMLNNAGIGVGGEFQDVGPDAWNKIVNINLLGVVFGTQAAYRHMRRQGSGQIVNIASILGLCSGVLQTAYSTTKHGVIGMTQGLRAEAKAFGVKVQMVCPGYIETSLFDTALLADGIHMDTIRENIPIKFLDAETAADKILKGVEKNQAYVVFPFYARLIWWVNRLSPALYITLSSLFIRKLRKDML